MAREFRGALVNKSAAQAILASTTTVMAWGAEVYDTHGFHDNAVNNSRLTVPAGVTKVRLSSNMRNTNVTGQLVGAFLKNGASFPGAGSQDTDTAGTDNINLISAVVACVAGDYFEVTAFCASACSIDAVNETWFAIEALEWS